MSERFNIFDNLHPANSKLTEYEEHLELVKEGFEIEVLNEAEVYQEPKLSIHVDPSNNTNFPYDPYIKVYNGPQNTATHIVRIYLKDAGLDYSHRNRNGRYKDLQMTNNIAKKLNEIMNLRYTQTYVNKYKVKKTRDISVYGYIWAIIHTLYPEAPYIEKPDFTKFYIRKE